MHRRTLNNHSYSGMKPIFARWFSFTVLIFISPLEVYSFPDTVFLSIGRGRGNSWSDFSIRAISIPVNQLKNCRTSHLPRLNRLFLQWTNQFKPSFWKFLLRHFQVLGGENPYFKFLLIHFISCAIVCERPGYVTCRTLNLPFSFHFTNASAGSKRPNWRSLAFAACAGFSISIFLSEIFTGMACSHCWALPFYSS